MRGPDRLRWVAVLAGLAGLALLATTAPGWGSNLGRKIEWLDVQRVEVSGTRLIAPHEVLALSGIERGRHLLDELGSLEAKILAHSGIAGVEISRKAPHTLRIRVEEKQPVAYVDGEVLRLASERGELLPYDPAALRLDLPIVRANLADSAGSEKARRILGEMARLDRLDPLFVADVSEVRWGGEEGDILVLAHRLGKVLLPIGATAARMEELRGVFADLERRFPRTAGEGRPPGHSIDLRFGDQIVVLPSPPRELH